MISIPYQAIVAGGVIGILCIMFIRRPKDENQEQDSQSNESDGAVTDEEDYGEGDDSTCWTNDTGCARMFQLC